MVNTGQRDGNGNKKMKPVITLLTCSTLPYNDNEDEEGDNNGGELCHYDVAIASRIEIVGAWNLKSETHYVVQVWSCVPLRLIRISTIGPFLLLRARMILV